MEETARALPGDAVQETSFEDDSPRDDRAPPPQQRGRTPEPVPNTNTTGDQGPHGTSRAQYGAVSSDAEADAEPEPSSRLTTTTKSATRARAPDLLRGLLMVLFALDHNTRALNAWQPETGRADAAEPARPVAYAVRSLTHIAAPGFIFLLCAGTVYFGRSRRAQGWSARALAWHFLQRAVVLALVGVPLGLLLTLGRVWFLGGVLFALAVDYLLAGLLFLVVSRTEESLAFGLLRVLPDVEGDDAREPLLADRRGEEDIAPDVKIMRAADISWHVHNVFLLALTVAAAWWNIWLAPAGGRCGGDSSATESTTTELPRSNWVRIWFYPLIEGRFKSGYPPLAWLSFALFGLLYGRVILARPWTKTVLAMGNTITGLTLSVLFVLTRVLQFGNLSNGCLPVPEHEASQGTNPYLASWPSFFYLVRYPPDLAYWAYGLGANLLLLAFFGVMPAVVALTVLNPLVVYGTSALFFYVVHIVLLFLTRLVWLNVMGHNMGWQDPLTGEEAVGVDRLWVYWLNWALVLVVMYPLCRWYGSFKKTKGPDSIWKFF